MNLNPLNWLVGQVRKRVADAVAEGIAQGVMDGLDQVGALDSPPASDSPVALLQKRMKALSAPQTKDESEEAANTKRKR